ncbi:MAG TPA: transglutaminase domain-containing protein, partial [Kiritimatiellia bacterium]
MKTRAIKTVIVAVWLLFGAWFIRYEAFPAFFTNTLEGYKDLFSHGELFVDSWMKILYNDKPIGYTETQIEVIDDDPLEHFRITSRTSLKMNLMGEMQDVNIVSLGGLDVLYHLQRFTFALSSRRYGLRIEGTRKRGNMFSVRVRSDAGVQKMSIEIPDDVVMYSPATEMAMGRLKPGETMHVKSLDPTTMAIEDIVVKALRRESRDVMGVPTDTTVLGVSFHGAELLSWVDANGKVVRQETPFGWIMEACTAEEAVAIRVDASKAEDMLGGMAVGVRGAHGDLRGAESLRIRLIGITPERHLLSSNRQAIETTESNSVVLALSAARWPAAGPALELSPRDRKAFLASTTFVQADDPGIRERAQEITKGLTNDVDKARAIYEWVFRKVDKRPTVSLPSAVDVLQNLEGDCNEHTYLFTALARASGIPAQMRIGLFYKDGS